MASASKHSGRLACSTTTVVVWTTDHGDGLPRAKRSIYDSGLRVPFIVRLPNRERAGTVDTRLVSFVDLAPTLLGLAGAPIPPHLHGQDFLAEAAPRRRYVHAARDRLDELPDRSRAVRDSRFKYIRNALPERPLLGPLYFRENLAAMAELRRLHREQALAPVLARYLEPFRAAEELYDLADDPDEMRNRINDPAYRDELRRLREELDRWLHEVGDMSAQPEVDMVTPADVAGRRTAGDPSPGPGRGLRWPDAQRRTACGDAGIVAWLARCRSAVLVAVRRAASSNPPAPGSKPRPFATVIAKAKWLPLPYAGTQRLPGADQRVSEGARRLRRRNSRLQIRSHPPL